MLKRSRRRKKPLTQSQGSKEKDDAQGHPGGPPAPKGHPNGQGAEATTVRETATGPASTESLRGSETVRGRRERAGTVIGIEGTEGTGRGGAPAVQTGTKNDENARGVAVLAGNEGVNVETKTEMAGMTGAGGRTGSTIKIEVQKGRGPGIERTGVRLMTRGIKMTGTDTEMRGRPKGQAGVEAGRGGTRVGLRRRAGKEIAATTETGRKMESSALTNVVVAKRGAIISGSLVTTMVDTVNAEGVIALSKCHLAAILPLLLLCFFHPFLT